MNADTKIDEKKYARLVAKTAPRVPANEQEYEALVSRVEELMAIDENELSNEEAKLLDLLSLLAEKYEETHHPIGKATPHEILRELMEQRGLAHKDVWKLFNSKGIASEVLTGKRQISKAHARVLAAFFHVSAEVFI